LTPEISAAAPAALPDACAVMQERLVLFAAGELEESEGIEVLAHTQICLSCAGMLLEEERFVALVDTAGVAAFTAPDPNLLAGCRARLSDSLDEQESGRFVRWLKGLFGPGYFAWKPLVTAALLLIVGFAAGRVLPWEMYFPRQTAAPPDHPRIASAGAMPTTDVAGITWTPTSDNVPPRVQFRLEEKQPLVVQGTVNNDQVKESLLTVLRDGGRYQPDVRMQSVDLLKPRCGDDDVRQAMCVILRTDPNPGLRLKALEALRDTRSTPGIQQALFQALRNDSNAGVRVEAADSLMALANNGTFLPAPDDMKILRESMLRDSNNYVRLQSTAILQDLNQASGHVVSYNSGR
jgi:hypothetical protein